VFEPYAHFILSNLEKDETVFKIRNLNTSEVEDLKLAKMVTVEMENRDLDSLSLVDNEYYIPTDSQFAVIDSWTKCAMFQMTVSTNHPIKSGAKQFKCLEGKVRPRIIFVVPNDIAENFPQQPLVLANGSEPKGGHSPRKGWNDVQQYVLGL